MKFIAFLAFILTLAQSQVCARNNAQQQSNVIVTSTVTGISFSSYLSGAGITASFTSGTTNTPIPITIKNFSYSDNTVLRVSLKAIAGITNFTSTPITPQNSASRTQLSTSSFLYVYFGFKASINSITFYIIPTGSTGSFEIHVIKSGWNNGFTCQQKCDKVVYPLTVITKIAGQYSCFEDYLAKIVMFALLIFLFFIS